MATVTISALTAVLAGDLDDTARVPVDDNDSHTRKATIAQLRTQIFSGAGVPLTCGALSATTISGTTGTFSQAGDNDLTIAATAASQYAGILFKPTTNVPAQVANCYIRASWASDGMVFRLPRDVGTHGFKFLNSAGTQLFFIDSVAGDATLAAGLTATTGKLTALGAFVAADKYVIVDAAGNLHVSALGPLS